MIKIVSGARCKLEVEKALKTSFTVFFSPSVAAGRYVDPPIFVVVFEGQRWAGEMLRVHWSTALRPLNASGRVFENRDASPGIITTGR